MDRIRLNASEWMDFRSGEKKCFLLTNGLGGYCSLTVMGNAARNDQALLMGALKAPTVREHLISNVWETLEVDGEETELFSQEFVNRTQNVEGFRFLEGFEMGSLPVWFYRVKGIEIEKTIGMVQGENTVLVRYRVRSGKKGSFSVRPVMRFAAKGEQLQEGQNFAVDRKCIASNGVILSYGTNGELQMEKERIWRDLFFEQDARDGRDGIGSAVVNHRIRFEMTGDGREQVFFVVYSLADDVDKWDEERIALWIEGEEKRQEMIAEKSGISDPVGKRLAVSASQYITERASTGGKSIMAGFPYFADWGRDTMISLPGCTLAIGEYEECKSILRTFMAYTKALYYFAKEDMENASKFIKMAFDANIHVPKYLLDLEIIEEIPSKYEVGDEGEAMNYYEMTSNTWISVDKSLYWILDEYFDYMKKNKIKTDFKKKDVKKEVDAIYEMING